MSTVLILGIVVWGLVTVIAGAAAASAQSNAERNAWIVATVYAFTNGVQFAIVCSGGAA